MCLAVPGRITAIETGGVPTMADVDFVGESRRVCLDYLPGLAVGDFVIVHAGYALTRVSAEEAANTVGLMKEFGLLDEGDRAMTRVAPEIPVAAVGGAVIDHALSADLAAAALMLARRFAAGGTLWCISPEWEPHANHVAVEFVHPVIVGKKALPAVALTGPDLVATVRVSVRPGDVVVAVASADTGSVRSVMRRAPAWGASTLWIGSGARPTAGAADHVLWLDDPDPRLPATGGFVLLYHLLWELTHVCFEHPGLLTVPTAECTDDVCVTCSDEGRLGEVLAALDPGRALVRAAGGQEQVDTMLVEAVEPGDLLLIHAGMAISKLDESLGR